MAATVLELYPENRQHEDARIERVVRRVFAEQFSRIVTKHVQDEIEKHFHQLSKAQQELANRVTVLEERSSIEYVRPRLGPTSRPAPSLHESIRTKLVALRDAVRNDDEVEQEGVATSLRADFRNLKNLSRSDKLRRFALGHLQDALTFTPLNRLDDQHIVRLQELHSIVDAEVVTVEDVDKVRNGLLGMRFELYPVAQDGG